MSDAVMPAFVNGLPESVRAYLNDRAIAEAVDHLTAVKGDKLPPGLTWEEYDNFLAARAAAHLARAEYPIAVKQFWHVVWGNSLPPAWRPATMDDMEDGLVGPGTCWDDKEIGVLHERPGFYLYTLAGFTNKSVVLAFWLEDENEKPLITEAIGPFEWHTKGPYEEWLVSEWKHSIAQGDLWTELAAARNEALREVSERVGFS